MSKKFEDRLGRIDHRRVAVAPSILAADFARLGEEIAAVEAAGAEVIHIDVMDGHFVPNISVGPPVVASLRKTTSLPFDVHLMIERPEQYVEPFAEAGADNLTVHVEVEADTGELLKQIRRAGCNAGLVVKPATPAEAVAPWVHCIDLVLVMSVEPGFGGQKFMDSALDKLRQIRSMIDRSGNHVHLEVDGGIDETTAPKAIAAGANLLVAGTSVFRHPEGCRTALDRLRGN